MFGVRCTLTSRAKWAFEDSTLADSLYSKAHQEGEALLSIFVDGRQTSGKAKGYLKLTNFSNISYCDPLISPGKQ